MTNLNPTLARSVLLLPILCVSLLVVCGCGGESAESVKLREMAPTVHSTVFSADKAELEKLLAEIGFEPSDNESTVKHVTPSGEAVEVQTNLLRAVVKQQLAH